MSETATKQPYTGPPRTKEEKILFGLFPPRFTEQQIEDYCEKIDSLGPNGRANSKQLIEAVQIIRQLQNGCKILSGLANVHTATSGFSPYRTTTHPEIVQPGASSEA